MIKEEVTNVSKADEKLSKEETNNVGKADGSATKLFDPKLYYVLTTILDLKLDGTHSKYRDILSHNNILEWEDFTNCDEIDDIKNLKYTNEQGNVIEFLKREMNRLTKLWNFISPL